MIGRSRKILRISQAHLAPGMNLELWREILQSHGVSFEEKDPWPKLSDKQVNAIFAQIAGIVKAAQLENPPETIKPVDLYQTAASISQSQNLIAERKNQI